MLYMVNLTVTIFVLFTLQDIKMKCVQLILNTASVVLILFFVYLKGFVILVACLQQLETFIILFIDFMIKDIISYRFLFVGNVSKKCKVQLQSVYFWLNCHSNSQMTVCLYIILLFHIYHCSCLFVVAKDIYVNKLLLICFA